MARLALFDLDGTLVDRDTAFATAVAGLCVDLNFGPETETWMRAEFADRANPGDLARMRHIFDLTEPVSELWQAYVTRMAAAVSCRRAVHEGLAGLRAVGWTIGIVTNGRADIQHAKLTATGLAELVDGIAASGDIGVRKPDPRLFELAAERCRAALPTGTMIGDDPARDIGGGHAAGMRTIWLRGRSWPSGVPAPHHTVDDVLDAIAVLLNTRQE